MICNKCGKTENLRFAIYRDKIECLCDVCLGLLIFNLTNVKSDCKLKILGEGVNQEISWRNY